LPGKNSSSKPSETAFLDLSGEKEEGGGKIGPREVKWRERGRGRTRVSGVCVFGRRHLLRHNEG